MKKLTQIWLCTILGFCCYTANAKPNNFNFNNNLAYTNIFSTPILDWTLQNNNDSRRYGKAISTDNSGNIYTTGTHYFIDKYNSNGSLVWGQALNIFDTYGYGISVNKSSNNIYTAGQTQTGLYGQKQNGKIDYFIAKYDTSGNEIWCKQVGAGNGGSSAQGITTDNNGNIYVTGFTNIGISGGTQTGLNDYFIARYDESGNLIWSNQVGGKNYYGTGGQSIAYGINADSFGNVYITGWTDVGISGESITSAGENYFIAKYDISGNLIWTRILGGSTFPYSAAGFGVAIDSQGAIYITGVTSGSLSGQKQKGIWDYFIVKYDSNGNLLWTKQVGARNGTTYGQGISINNLDNIYLTGYTNVGISGQKQNGVYDYFIARYDISGNLISTIQGGNESGSAYGYGITTNKLGDIYVTGSTTAGLYGGQQSGVYDYFIVKYLDY